MAETDSMSIDERRKYLHKIWGRYRDSTKQGKGQLLTEAEEVTGLHRKSLMRILNGRLSRKKREKQRGKRYSCEVEDALLIIARCLDYPCAERLKPNLSWMAEHLAVYGELKLDAELCQLLANISITTMKRLMKKRGKAEAKLAFRKSPGQQQKQLSRIIPIQRIDWQTEEPGHFEVDLVHHCGPTTGGIYVYSLQMVDIAIGWAEPTAIYGNSFQATKDGFDYLLARLPFNVIELHPDNGAEFINQLLYRHWHTLVPNLQVSRSKPYRKNDNRFVEENNHSLIRAYIGHSRFDSLEQLTCLRALYDKLWLYHNFFLPVMHLKEKRITEHKTMRRIHDQALTPLDRLIQTAVLSKAREEELLETRRAINPMFLRSQIDALIEKLLALPCLKPGEKLDFYETKHNLKEPSVTLSFEPTTTSR
jgi:hypothetical protein